MHRVKKRRLKTGLTLVIFLVGVLMVTVLLIRQRTNLVNRAETPGEKLEKEVFYKIEPVIKVDGRIMKEGERTTAEVNQRLNFEAGESKVVSETVKDTRLVSYLWNFGNYINKEAENFSPLANSSFAYSKVGTYEAMLTVGDDLGNKETTRMEIVVGSGEESQKLIRAEDLMERGAKDQLPSEIKTEKVKLSSDPEKVAVLVDRIIYPMIQPELERTLNEARNFWGRRGKQIDFIIRAEENWANPDWVAPSGRPSWVRKAEDDIRYQLQNLYNQDHIIGAMLVGLLPYPTWMATEPGVSLNVNPRPMAAYYEDLNGIYSDEMNFVWQKDVYGHYNRAVLLSAAYCQNWQTARNPEVCWDRYCYWDGKSGSCQQHDGVYDSHDNSYTNPYRLEIWVSLIRPPVLITRGVNPNEINYLKNYLNKVWGYYTTEYRGLEKAYMSYPAHIWSPVNSNLPSYYLTNFIGSENIKNKINENTRCSEYLSEDQNQYRLEYLDMHSGSMWIQPCLPGSVSSSQLLEQPLRSVVTAMEACWNANFDIDNMYNVATSTIFGNRWGLVMTGFTSYANQAQFGSLCTYCYNFFYSWQNNHFASAYLEDKNNMIAAAGGSFLRTMDPRRWVYEKTLFGFPLIEFFNSTRASPTPTATETPTPTPTPYPCSRCSPYYKFCQENWLSNNSDCRSRIRGSVFYGLDCNCRNGPQERSGDDCRWQDCMPTICDVNCDGAVDFNLGEGGLDYRQLRDCIGSSRTQRTANCQNDCHFNRADYSQDGWVDIVDFSSLRNFCSGQSYVTPTPYPTATPTCAPPDRATRLSGPEPGQRINYGWPTLRARDDSYIGSCYPHDIVFSAWQGANKIVSSGFIEDAIGNVGSEYSWQMSPVLSPGDYQWRINLRNTASQTVNFDLIPKTDFTVCNRPAIPQLVELTSENKIYQGENPFKVFKGDNITFKAKDVSAANSCFPHEFIFNIWSADGGTRIKTSDWQTESDPKLCSPAGTCKWTFGTKDMTLGDYQIRANISNDSIDEGGQRRQINSRALSPLSINFRVVDWHSSCNQRGTYIYCDREEGAGTKNCINNYLCENCYDNRGQCTGVCSLGRSCQRNRMWGDCRCQ